MLKRHSCLSMWLGKYQYCHLFYRVVFTTFYWIRMLCKFNEVNNISGNQETPNKWTTKRDNGIYSITSKSLTLFKQKISLISLVITIYDFCVWNGLLWLTSLYSVVSGANVEDLTQANDKKRRTPVTQADYKKFLNSNSAKKFDNTFILLNLFYIVERGNFNLLTWIIWVFRLSIRS
jgi:hypothetical protein